MAFWDFLRKERRDGRENNGRDFSDDERDKGQITRLERAIRRQRMEAMRLHLENLKQKQEEMLMRQQIGMLEDDLYGDEEDEDEEPGIDGLFSELIQNVMRKNPQAASAPEASAPVSVSIPDEQLRSMKTKIPAPMLKKLRGMNDEQIVEAISMHYPDLIAQCDEDTVKRAVAVIRE